MEDDPVFSISPNPTSMFLTDKLKDSVIRFTRAINRRQGLCMILGANGLGKSTLLRYIALKYESNQQCSVSYVPDSRKCGASAFSFLKTISEDFDIPPKRSQAAQLDAIELVVTANYQEQKNTIIFVDEAQRLSLDTLEVIRALLNYETDTHKLIQIVLAGQLELRDRLLEKRYSAVRSRIVAPLLMAPLTLAEATAMIEFRLNEFNTANPFTAEAIREIYTHSFGIPRNILSLCQQAYDLSGGDRKVSDDDVLKAFEALRLEAEQSKEEFEPLATAV